MEDAREYLRLRIISKGGYIKDGKVVNETIDGYNNVMRDINWIAPMMESYAYKKIQAFKIENGLV